MWIKDKSGFFGNVIGWMYHLLFAAIFLGIWASVGYGFIIVLSVCFIGLGLWQLPRGKDLLDDWAEQNQFEILYSKRHFFPSGPFKRWQAGFSQSIFAIRLRDTEGSERSCWVRCSSWGLTTRYDKIDVIWDEN